MTCMQFCLKVQNLILLKLYKLVLLKLYKKLILHICGIDSAKMVNDGLD